MKSKRFLIVFLFPFLFLSCATLWGDRGASDRRSGVDYSHEPLRNPAVSAYVNQIARHLVQYADREKMANPKVEVFIPKTSRIQGTSTIEGSSIEITRGMLNILTNEAGLACLLGHEIGHKVLHRNKQKYKPRNKLEEIFLPEEIARAKWNQRREGEADEYGAILCSKAGYDAYAFLNYFERLSQFQEGGLVAALEELPSTHKDFRSRAKALRRLFIIVGDPSEESRSAEA